MKPNNSSEKSVEIIRQNQIAFDLKDGTRLLLHKEDYETITSKIQLDVIVKMMLDYPDKVFIGHNSHGKEKINSLYEILKEQGESMSAEMRESYLKTILELSASDDVDGVNFKDEKDKIKLLKQA